MLTFWKILHSITWVVMASSIFIAFYFALIGQYDAWFFVPASLVATECLVILLNHWKCPITDIAERYTEDRSANFDIYLPEWLAKHNKEIFSIIIALEVLIVLIFGA